MVAVPHMPEQRLVAARLAELGLGVQLPPDEVTGQRLRRAVHQVRAGVSRTAWPGPRFYPTTAARE